MNWSAKIVFITGASGFIGATLVRHFLGLGCRVHVSLRPTTPEWRLRAVLPEVTVQRLDLIDGALVERTLASVRADYIIHAAVGRKSGTAEERRATLTANVTGTHNLLESAAAMGCERFLHLGGSLEIGPRRRPLRESDRLDPELFYGASKAAATIIAQQFARSGRLPLTILRLFSVYGYWEDPKRLIPTAIVAALLQQPMALTQTDFYRDFIFCEDVALACEKALTAPNAIDRLFHIGSGQQHSNSQAVALIGEIAGRPIVISGRDFPAHQSDTTCWVSDNHLARRLLGWAPSHTLRQGLEKTYVWLEKNLEHYHGCT